MKGIPSPAVIGLFAAVGNSPAIIFRYRESLRIVVSLEGRQRRTNGQTGDLLLPKPQVACSSQAGDTIYSPKLTLSPQLAW